jgi:hypothetical protein
MLPGAVLLWSSEVTSEFTQGQARRWRRRQTTKSPSDSILRHAVETPTLHELSMGLRVIRGIFRIQVLLAAVTVSAAQSKALPPSAQGISPLPALVNQYCAGCHNPQVKEGGLDLDSIRLEGVTPTYE